MIEAHYGSHSPTQHGGIIDIPKKDRKKPVYSVLRDPFDAFESTYQFRLRNPDPYWLKPELKSKFPHFPKLTTDEWIDFIEEERKIEIINKGILNKESPIGNRTLKFIFMFFKNPYEVVKKIDKSYIESDHYKKDIANVSFLHQNNLNQNLYDLLLKYHYPKSEIDFILSENKINTSKKVLENQTIWTEKSLSYFLEKEKLILKIYKDLGYEAKIPNI